MANAAPSEPNSKQKAKIFIRSSRYIHATPSASQAILSLNLPREVFFALAGLDDEQVEAPTFLGGTRYA
jgi:hypothetical protein